MSENEFSDSVRISLMKLILSVVSGAVYTQHRHHLVWEELSHDLGKLPEKGEKLLKNE